MKSGIAFIVLFTMLIPAGAFAGDLSGGSFPYGLLEIRGHSMEMNEDGKFRIYSGSTTFVEGIFETNGYEITITDRGGEYACRGEGMNPGSYHWTVHDQGLYLMLIEDQCTARRSAFLEGPLNIE
ncbi:MAG: hypothetical protein R8K46_08590 [Mariprofundaceae bacterium]